MYTRITPNLSIIFDLLNKQLQTPRPSSFQCVHSQSLKSLFFSQHLHSLLHTPILAFVTWCSPRHILKTGCHGNLTLNPVRQTVNKRKTSHLLVLILRGPKPLIYSPIINCQYTQQMIKKGTQVRNGTHLYETTYQINSILFVCYCNKNQYLQNSGSLMKSHRWQWQEKNMMIWEETLRGIWLKS